MPRKSPPYVPSTNTAVKAGQTFPAGTLFTTDALTTAPLAANYVSVQPAPASIRRIAFQVGASLGAGATSSSFPFVVTVNTGINASNPIWEITDAFGKNFFNNTITDQSGDAIFNQAQAADLANDIAGIRRANPHTPLSVRLGQIEPLVDRLSAEVDG